MHSRVAVLRMGSKSRIDSIAFSESAPRVIQTHFDSIENENAREYCVHCRACSELLGTSLTRDHRSSSDTSSGLDPINESWSRLSVLSAATEEPSSSMMIHCWPTRRQQQTEDRTSSGIQDRTTRTTVFGLLGLSEERKAKSALQKRNQMFSTRAGVGAHDLLTVLLPNRPHALNQKPLT